MVKAILGNRKTMTRRVAKGQRIYCTYGQVGDRLWVRETWAYINNQDIDGSENYYEYKADKPNAVYPGDWPVEEAKGNSEAPKWRPSIFMPRRASRITLEINNVRVERVQEITEDDALTEGVDWYSIENKNEGIGRCQQAFRKLWDSINSKRGYSWESNPWVWVIEFRRVSQ